MPLSVTRGAAPVWLRLLATGGFAGYVPLAPGTAGSFVAGLLYWWVLSHQPVAFWLAMGLGFLVGWGVATRAETVWGRDARQIVIDEVVGMWVVFAFVPRGLDLAILGFVFFRLFDIVKPFPVYRSQRLPGGLGVMVDDVLAAIYTNILLQLYSGFLR